MAVYLNPKLDSGYGWLVTFACFSSCFIMQGLTRAAGVLYVAIIDTYGVSREVATTPFSLRYGVRNMVGPVVGIVGQRFGIRSAVVVGGILSSIGAALCSVAPDILWITVLWGVVHGIGYGLCCTIHILILNQYFDKYRATSIALALTGDCFGTFVFPTLLEFLLSNYGVDGTFLILGAIALNVVPAGMLMRAPDWVECLKVKTKDDSIPKSSSNQHITGIENKAFDDREVCLSNLYLTNLDKVAIPKWKYNSLMSNLKISSVKGNYFNNVLNSDFENASSFDAEKQIGLPLDVLPTEKSCINNLSHKELYSPTQTDKTRRRLGSIFPQSSTIENKYLALLEKESEEKPISSMEIVQNETLENAVSLREEDVGTSQNNCNIQASEIDNRPIVDIHQSSETVLEPSAVELENHQLFDDTSTSTKRKDSVLDKILAFPIVVISEMKDYKPLDEPQTDQNYATFNKTVAPNGHLTFPMRKHSLNKFNPSPIKCNRISEDTAPVTPIEESQLPEDTVISVKRDCKVGVKLEKTLNALRQFLNLNIRPLMVLMGINLAAYSIVLIGVFTIIADFASDKEMEADASKFLIISFSVADLFGRIGFGMVLDRRWIKLSLYSGVNMAVMGISVLMIPLSSNYWYMMSCMAVFGMMQGGNAIVYPLLVSEYMNEGEENVALGCLVLYGGLMMFPLAPMIGFFRDTMGNYDGVFYTVGGICLLAGVLWILEPLLLNLQNRMSKKAVK